MGKTERAGERASGREGGRERGRKGKKKIHERMKRKKIEDSMKIEEKAAMEYGMGSKCDGQSEQQRKKRKKTDRK